MAQRILIATCFLMVALCLFLILVTFAESNRWTQGNLAMLNQTQRTNQEMLRQLEALANSARASSKVEEYIPVRFQLYLEDLGGPPAVGYQILLGRGDGGTSKEGVIRRDTDADGMADLGVVQPGDWEYRLQAGPWQSTGRLNAVPGTEVVKQITCPKVPPEQASVKVRVVWPAELADKNLRAIALFRHLGVSYQEPLRWNLRSSIQLLCGPKDEMAEIPSSDDGGGGGDAGNLQVWRDVNKTDQMGQTIWRNSKEDLHTPNRYFMYLDSTSILGGTNPIELDAGRYALDRLILLRTAGFPPSRNVHQSGSDAPGDPVECLAMFDRRGQSIPMSIVGEGNGGSNLVVSEVPISGLTKIRSSRAILNPFEAPPGKTSEWTITLPEELIKLVKRKLNAK